MQLCVPKKVKLFFGFYLTLSDDGISGTRFDCPGFTAMMEGGGGRERGCYHCER